MTVRAKQHSLMLGNLRFNVGETARSQTSTSAVSAVVTSCLEKVEWLGRLRNVGIDN